MKKLLLSAGVIALMISCEQKPSSVSSYPSGSDSAAATTENSPEAKEERNKQTALNSVSTISQDVDAAFKDVSPDAVDYMDGSMPPQKNVDSVKTMIKGFIASFPDYKGENLVAVADGDHVFVYGDWSGTFKKDWMGMKATGKTFKVKDVDIFKFNDQGKIIEHRSIMPWETMMKQVGAVDPKK